MQEWVTQQFQQPFAVNSTWNTTSPAELAPAADDSVNFDFLLFEDTPLFPQDFEFMSASTMSASTSTFSGHDSFAMSTDHGGNLCNVAGGLMPSGWQSFELPDEVDYSSLAETARVTTSKDTSPTSSANTERTSSIHTSPKKRSAEVTPTSHSPTSQVDGNDRFTKRQRNTEAARRYRQRKVDRTTELEDELAAMTKERDDLKLQLARSETEVVILRGLVGK